MLRRLTAARAVVGCRQGYRPAVLVRWIAVGVAALAYGLLLVLLRGEPSVASDQGVFLSVAARILDGDHLYSEVVDNKDPLFFYTYAAALAAGGWRGPFLLDAVWLGLAALSMALLVRELRAPRAAVVASFLVYPLALTAGWYLAGMSMLAGLAVAPLAPWFWLRSRFAAAGLVLAVVMLFKLNLAPLAVAPITRARPLLAADADRLARSSAGGARVGWWSACGSRCPRCPRRVERLSRHDRVQLPLRERPE